MIPRDVLGLYGPNREYWDDQVYRDIADARVRWVVWRADADTTAPGKLANMGVNVIAQCPDAFGDDPHLDPALECQNLFAEVSQYCPPGTPVVFDNEPNLNPLRAGSWFAEQWTRYARAYMATWRYYDSGGQFPVVLPALAVGPDRNGSLWNQTQTENLTEADGIGLHAYWQSADQIQQPHFGRPWHLIPLHLEYRPKYVIEYGNTLPGLTHSATLDQYELFLGGLPSTVRCACLFGLHLTDEWNRFRITRDVIEWLARLE